MSIFRFKQFEADQRDCAMKINTDGVLLGALTEAVDPRRILDIGTGTGVIALMMAQRYPNAMIDAVETDQDAAKTAGMNFKNSRFAGRVTACPVSFEAYFEQHPCLKYDLIVSNPPFFLNSLASPGLKKALARHTDEQFYERLIALSAANLTETGTCQLILPVTTAGRVKQLLGKNQLYLHKQVAICSYRDDEPHRQVLMFGKWRKRTAEQTFVIYDEPKFYSAVYKEALKDFLTIF